MTATMEKHECGADMREDGLLCTHCDAPCPLIFQDGTACINCARQMQYEELGVAIQTSVIYWRGADPFAYVLAQQKADGAAWYTHPRA